MKTLNKTKSVVFSAALICVLAIGTPGALLAEEVPTSTISGTVFHDLDNDGVTRETGEPAITNWTLRLYDYSSTPWTLVAETKTNENGLYSFTGLGVGSYRVCEVMQSDWTQTFASSKITNVSPFAAEEGQWCVTRNVLTAGTNPSSASFGNFFFGTIDDGGDEEEETDEDTEPEEEPEEIDSINTKETAFVPKNGKVKMCHFNNETDVFELEEVNMMSIVGGKGHGQHGDDIIPSFWYINKEGDVVKYQGNDWNQTGKAIYVDGCKGEE